MMDPVTVSEHSRQTAVMRYTRLFNDEDGTGHFEDKEFTLVEREFAPRRRHSTFQIRLMPRRLWSSSHPRGGPMQLILRQHVSS